MNNADFCLKNCILVYRDGRAILYPGQAGLENRVEQAKEPFTELVSTDAWEFQKARKNPYFYGRTKQKN